MLIENNKEEVIEQNSVFLQNSGSLGQPWLRKSKEKIWKPKQDPAEKKEGMLVYLGNNSVTR